MALRMLRPTLATLDTRAAKPAPKMVDPFYQSAEYLAWRELVISRAGRRCEDIDQATGRRCTKAEPRYRMYADHIVERKDGGADLDLDNGRCRCASHHVAKTHAARAARMARPIAAPSASPSTTQTS
ncbi:MAG: HNH endonuclease [Rhizobiaceae bacterium]|nr:HNH endonuclease [Rhizobiaceae bacterium]